MRKLLVLLSFVSLFWLALPATTEAQSTANFTIHSFTADYYVGRTDAKIPTMKVDEQILTEFPDYNQNHGILRVIPTTYNNQPLDINITSVTNEANAPIAYTTSKSSGNLVLKIGDAKKYVHGNVLYKISYTLKNQIAFFEDHDELYWDVNGDQWEQPFGEVTARIHIPAELTDALQERQACYSGVYQSDSQNCTMNRETLEDGGVLITASTEKLGPKSTLTFVVGFAKDTFGIDKAAQRWRFVTAVLGVGGLLLLPLGAVIYVILRWRKVGRDPKGRGTIIPQYIPPKGLTPLASDVIMNEKLRTVAVTAQIIALATQHYIAIYETEKKKTLGFGGGTEYSLELTKPADDLDKESQEITTMVFGDKAAVGTKVSMDSLKNKLHKDYGRLSKRLPKDMYEDGYFANNPAVAVRNSLILGFVILAGGAAAMFILLQIAPILMLIGVGLIIAGVIVLASAYTMPARTAKGVEVREYMLGLEEYIKLAEADRIRYLQSPKGVRQYGKPDDPDAKIKLFEKLLPYAMLFGLEKDWANEFKDIYTEPPEWYHGNIHTFNAIYLATAMNSFNAASATSFAPPSSSRTSGFGGGFSGGGGGGGGGGGW